MDGVGSVADQGEAGLYDGLDAHQAQREGRGGGDELELAETLATGFGDPRAEGFGRQRDELVGIETYTGFGYVRGAA